LQWHNDNELAMISVFVKCCRRSILIDLHNGDGTTENFKLESSVFSKFEIFPSFDCRPLLNYSLLLCVSNENQRTMYLCGNIVES
jgi:hypothetical protein